MTTLFDLPLELLHYVLDFLPLSSVYRLGSACRYLHRVIHQDDEFWRRRVKLESHLRLLNPDWQCSTPEESNSWRHDTEAFVGLLCDPALQGNKELYLIYSKEFQTELRLTRQKIYERSNFEKLLRHLMPKILSTRSFCDPDFAARCALFGPGIESARTKHLVHRIVNAHDDLFEAKGFVPGLPGGFGSGVRIDFKKSYTFELICLYTNSERVRECQQGLNRLLASNNRLLVSDVTPEINLPEKFLHANVHTLLPTLDALLFAIDNTAEENDDFVSQYAVWRRELEIMLTGMQTKCNKDTPLLLLCCTNGPPATRKLEGLSELSQQLGLDKVARPWAVFSVDICNMAGLEKALDWLLYRVQKRRVELEYHSHQGRS